MAMSKEDYYREGYSIGSKGNVRPEGNSWQQKAMQAGYDEAVDIVATESDMKAEDESETVISKETHDIKLMCVDVGIGGDMSAVSVGYEIKPISRASHPAIHHLNCLERKLSVETDSFRSHRLAQKIVKLASKWANRGVSW